MILVEALDTYTKNNIKDSELNKIPCEGERFEVSEARLNVLLGNNEHNKVFVKVVESNDEDLVSEETVQAVAEAIVDTAEEENKTVEEVVSEIVEETKPKTKSKKTKKEE